MGKTVYFLGSGFSKEAGGLVQNEIIKTILDEDFTRNNERLIKAKNNFIGFLKEELHIYEDHYCSVQLEDIFTPIDVVSGTDFLLDVTVLGDWWSYGKSLTR